MNGAEKQDNCIDYPEAALAGAKLLARQIRDELGPLNEPRKPVVLLVRELREEVEGLRAFKRSVDEALNSGDGSYRP